MKFGDSDYENIIHRARLALANSNPSWEEHKHPRRADGKFGSGGGTDAAGKGGENEDVLGSFVSSVTKNSEDLKQLASKVNALIPEAQRLRKSLDDARKPLMGKDAMLKKEEKYESSLSAWNKVRESKDAFDDACSKLQGILFNL